jgi:hypothetical protein
MTNALTIRPQVASAPAARLAALIASIEASPIWAAVPGVETSPTSSFDWAPAGYDEADVRVLQWIASQRRDEIERRMLRELVG